MTIPEKREEIRNEEITLKKKTYQARIGRAYNRLGPMISELRLTG